MCPRCFSGHFVFMAPMSQKCIHSFNKFGFSAVCRDLFLSPAYNNEQDRVPASVDIMLGGKEGRMDERKEKEERSYQSRPNAMQRITRMLWE